MAYDATRICENCSGEENWEQMVLSPYTWLYAMSGTDKAYAPTRCFAMSATAGSLRPTVLRDVRQCPVLTPDYSYAMSGTEIAYSTARRCTDCRQVHPAIGLCVCYAMFLAHIDFRY
eukprot:654706-Rhodomonas_salina.3